MVYFVQKTLSLGIVSGFKGSAIGLNAEPVYKSVSI